MEGLIPMMFKAVKKRRIRRQYSSLSAEGARSYNIADFYMSDSYMAASTPSPSHFTDNNMIGRAAHRRHKSMGDYSMTIAAAPPKHKKPTLVRFTSHRMFSCIGGGV
ncbi:hypothetical protein UlMin_016028 [Ulmus minor]